MKNICLITAGVLLVVFTAFNLFLPYALLLAALAAIIGLPCKFFKSEHAGECRLGNC